MNYNRGNYSRNEVLVADNGFCWYKARVPAKQKPSEIKRSFEVIKDSLAVVRRHPEIALYPYAATLFISISYPIVSSDSH